MNEYIFKLEAKEYEAEGIDDGTVVFKDNKPTLDLIESVGKTGKNMGITATLDNEINVPRGSNEGFLAKILKEHKKHESFKVPKKKKNCFTIVHYAGPVTYNVKGWMDKTKDMLHPDLVHMVETSSDSLVKILGAPISTGGKKKKKKGADTLGSKFRAQLQKLMKTLNKTEPQFCRCMKPNFAKKGDLFESQMMLDQLRYAGLMEVCRIRQIGFPVRKEFVQFFHRYRPISKSAGDYKKLVADIVAKGVCKEGTVQVGKTKVFMKNGAHIELEEAREESLYFVVTVMQKSVRGMLLRCASKRWKEIRQGLKAAIESRDIAQLKEWLEKSSELPGRGTHLAEVKAAHVLKERILAEQRCIAMLTQAIEAQEIPSLEEAVRSATEMNLDTPEGAGKVKEATDLIAHLILCKATVEELRAAIAAVSYDDVCRLLTKCGELGLNNDEMLQVRDRSLLCTLILCLYLLSFPFRDCVFVRLLINTHFLLLFFFPFFFYRARPSRNASRRNAGSSTPSPQRVRRATSRRSWRTSPRRRLSASRTTRSTPRRKSAIKSKRRWRRRSNWSQPSNRTIWTSSRRRWPTPSRSRCRIAPSSLRRLHSRRS